MSSIPLTVLDLIPMSSGSSPEAAVRNSVDLAQAAEGFGYERYWFTEHHLNPGVLGVSPAVAIALVAGATRTIRLGSAGVLMGHRTSLSVVEEFGLIDALYPGRLDLGLGRSLGRRPPTPDDDGGEGQQDAAVASFRARSGGRSHDTAQVTDNGLLLPKRYNHAHLHSPKVATTLSLLQQPGAYTPPYEEQVSVLLDLLRGTYRSEDGFEAHATPGEGRGVEVWILGSSGGESAEVAGRHGLRFAASYHHTPSTVMDAVDNYRAAFRPSADLERPYVCVSADVVVAGDDATAARLASGYGLWVRSIRTGAGAMPFATPEEAAAHTWSDEDRALVQDRIDTQLVGAPGTVADRLEQLQEATGADELAITTITHEHVDRVRSYELLAAEWQRRHP